MKIGLLKICSVTAIAVGAIACSGNADSGDDDGADSPGTDAGGAIDAGHPTAKDGATTVGTAVDSGQGTGTRPTADSGTTGTTTTAEDSGTTGTTTTAEDSGTTTTSEDSGTATRVDSGTTTTGVDSGTTGGGRDASTGADSSTPVADSGVARDSGTTPVDSGAPPTTGSCRPTFASGLNVAWIKFANDIPNPNVAGFTTLFQNTFNAGGRVVRWWLHTNGTATPGYDSSGMAKAISASNISDIKKVLDAAHAAGVAVNVSLWSFDMLQPSANAVLSQNTALLTNDTNRQAYITNVLTPLVTALKAYPGLYSWEIFNEPEGMTTQHGWVPAANKIDESFIQKSVNWMADAIHTADPNALVTNGAWTFVANSTAAKGGTNYYSNAALTAAGGRAKGTLDFYEVHYYGSNGSGVSPYTHAASFWALDKKIVMGEFWALDTDGVAAANLYTTIYSNGYNGAWAWQYENNDNSTNNTKWPAMQAPMQNLYTAHSAALNCQ